MVTRGAQFQPVENGTLAHILTSNRQENNGSLNSNLATVKSTITTISAITNVTNNENDDDVRSDSVLNPSIGSKCSLCSWVLFKESSNFVL